MASQNVVELRDDNFEQEVLKSDVPVLVDFWAEWCAPCRMIAPTIEELAAEFKGIFKVGKVDIETNQKIGVSYGIRNIPTLIMFKDGQMVKQFVGLQNKSDLKAAMNELLE